MSVYEALFLVDRGGVNHQISGARAHDTVQALDQVLVQRGDTVYRATYKKPLLPQFTRRFTYTREYDSVQGKYLHPKGDGVINFGHDFGTAGDFPAQEWINVRNRDAEFKDLDGQPFEIKDSTRVKVGDSVHIEDEGGDFEAWYIVGETDGWMKFKVQNVVNGRNNSNVGDVIGTKPSVDDGATLKISFHREQYAGWYGIDDDDLIAVWEDNKTKHIKGDLFKDLFPVAPSGSVSIAYTYDKALLTDDDTRKALFDGVSKFFWIEADGSWRLDPTKTGSIEIKYDELSQHEGIAYWGTNPDEFKFLANETVYTDVHFLPWCNTTKWVLSNDFCRGANLGYVHDFDTDGVYHSITGLQYIDTTKWTSLRNLFYSTPMQNVDWTGAATWNTSKVTNFSKVFRFGGTSAQCPVDLAAAWDFTKAEIASVFYSPKHGVPRWAERIQWGPDMPINALKSAGGGYYYDPDKDLCEDGLGPLDLRGWCVANQPTRPNDFFVSSFNVNDSVFNNLIYPLWGTCATKIEEFDFPAGKVIIDMRIHGDKAAGDVGKGRHIEYEGTEVIYPVIVVSGQAYVLPALTNPTTPLIAPFGDDCPDGYIFIGTPSTFEFGSNRSTNTSTAQFKMEVEFTSNCSTSTWAHQASRNGNNIGVFTCFTNIRGGLEYIDTREFTSLDYLFTNYGQFHKNPDDENEYTTSFPWEGCANWNTSKVTTMRYAMKRPTPDIPKLNWDFSKVTDAYALFSSGYGIPGWVEDIQWGPNLTNLTNFGSHFYSGQPNASGDTAANWYIGQKRPLDLSNWDVRNISSIPDYFMSTNPFEATGQTAKWVTLPVWGTTGS